jgi:hypothetical protein
MQVGDLVKYHPGLLHAEGETLQLGVVIEMDTDGTVLVKWPDKKAEYDLEFALEVVSENR